MPPSELSAKDPSPAPGATSPASIAALADLLARQAAAGQPIPWSPVLSVGIASIDSQHRVLLAYVNQLSGALVRGQSAEVLGDVIRGLEGYTRLHFRHEERLFALHGWTDGIDHAHGHRAFEAQLAGFAQRLASGDTTLATEVLGFMIRWLADHILVDDLSYSGFLQERGVR